MNRLRPQSETTAPPSEQPSLRLPPSPTANQRDLPPLPTSAARRANPVDPTQCHSLKIAIICFHSCPAGRLGEKNTGGMNVYVSQLARELADQGNHVDIFTRRHDPNEPTIIHLTDRARVIHLDDGELAAPKEDLHRHTSRFINALCQFQQRENAHYALLHSHYWLSGIIAMQLSSRWNIPHIATFHTLARTKQRARAGERESEHRASTEQQIMDNANAIIVSTHIEKDDIAKLYQPSSTPIEVIPPGVDLSLFQPIDKSKARRALGLDDNPTILYVGRIEPLKGIDILIRATSLLKNTPNIRLLIVGGNLENDAELDRLNSLATNLRISDIVTFTGSVNQRQLPAYYSAADVFVLPSWYESFGLVALEAMSCATPVVVSRVGGLKTFIENGKTGYLIPWRCPEPFAQTIETLLANPPLKKAIGNAARHKALLMSWSTMAQNALACYHKEINKD